MRILLLVAALLVSACGGSKSATAPTPPTAQIAGVWRGTATTTSVTGGECFAAAFQSTVGGSSAISVAFTQTGASVNATYTDSTTGGSCVYTGSIGASAIALTWVSCTASNTIGARCASGVSRDLLLQTSSFNGTASGSTITGMSAGLYNIVIGGTSAGVGTLTIVNSISLTRQ